MPPRKKSASQVEPKGITCTKCGCADLFVVYRQDVGRTRRRRLECRHCGHRMVSVERLSR